MFASHLECVFYEETFTDTSGQREEMKNGVKREVDFVWIKREGIFFFVLMSLSKA